MGLIRTPLTLSNPKHPDLAPMTVDALVDSGSLHLCIPEHVAPQLRLDALDEREVTLRVGPNFMNPNIPASVAMDVRYR